MFVGTFVLTSSCAGVQRTSSTAVPEAATADGERNPGERAGSRDQLLELRALRVRAAVDSLRLSREIDRKQEGSCAFYFDPDDRPAPVDENSPDEDRVAAEIAALRPLFHDPAQLGAFDRDVTEPFGRIAWIR